MDLNKNIKRLAHYRHSLRVQTLESNTGRKSSASGYELLQQILQNHSQNDPTHIPEVFLRQNSHSPKSGTKKIKQKPTRHPSLKLSRRPRANSDDDCGVVCKNHPMSQIFEVNMKDISQDPYMFNVYIGDLTALNDNSLLLKNSIKGVFVVGEAKDIEKFTCVSHGYFYVPQFYENFVREALKAAFKPLEQMIFKGNIMVHCGESDSYAIVLVIAFLIKKFSLLYEAAVEKVLKNKPGVFIYSKFETQLKHLERMCCLDKTE